MDLCTSDDLLLMSLTFEIDETLCRCVCVCVCVCVCERERERECVCLCLYIEGAHLSQFLLLKPSTEAILWVQLCLQQLFIKPEGSPNEILRNYHFCLPG